MLSLTSVRAYLDKSGDVAAAAAQTTAVRGNMATRQRISGSDEATTWASHNAQGGSSGRGTYMRSIRHCLQGGPAPGVVREQMPSRTRQSRDPCRHSCHALGTMGGHGQRATCMVFEWTGHSSQSDRPGGRERPVRPPYEAGTKTNIAAGTNQQERTNFS